jgi:DNA-binding transcriptional ArsR family regulator
VKLSWPLVELGDPGNHGAGARPPTKEVTGPRAVPIAVAAGARGAHVAVRHHGDGRDGAKRPEPPLRLALSPLATLTSLTLEAMGSGRGSPPAWFQPVRAALAADGVRALAAVVDPYVARDLPGCLVPTPLSFRPAIVDELQRLAAVSPHELVDDLRRDGLLDTPWSMVAQAPARWIADYVNALDRAWAAVRPLWDLATELLEEEARRVGLACLQAAFGPPSPAPLHELGGPAVVRGLGRHEPVAPGVVVTPVVGGRRAGFVKRDAGAVSYVAYPLPGARRLLGTARRRAPLDGLRRLLGGPRAELVQRLSEPQTAGALATAMQLAPSAITHHVSTLEQSGLVERERNGRHVLIHLTERGGALLDVYGAGEPAAV